MKFWILLCVVNVHYFKGTGEITIHNLSCLVQWTEILECSQANIVRGTALGVGSQTTRCNRTTQPLVRTRQRSHSRGHSVVLEFLDKVSTCQDCQADQNLVLKNFQHQTMMSEKCCGRGLVLRHRKGRAMAKLGVGVGVGWGNMAQRGALCTRAQSTSQSTLNCWDGVLSSNCAWDG